MCRADATRGSGTRSVSGPPDDVAWALRVERSKRGRGRLVPLARPLVSG
jgi:hypothetical protein